MSQLADDLSIPSNREIFIYMYVSELIKDYHEDPAGIIKEIPLNLKDAERYFALFITGHRYADTFRRMNDDEKSYFILHIIKELGIDKNESVKILQYLQEVILPMSQSHIGISDIIKKIADSKFEDKSKYFIMFAYGLSER